MKDKSHRYHYTVGYWARLIVEDGAIKTTPCLIDRGERPAAWFSSNPVWEGSTNKSWPDVGMKPTADVGGGIFRFVVGPETPLHDWEAYKVLSGVSAQSERALKRAARSLNGNHKQHYCSFEAVRSDQWLAIEKFDFELYRWVPATVDDMPSLESAKERLASRGSWQNPVSVFSRSC